MGVLYPVLATGLGATTVRRTVKCAATVQMCFVSGLVSLVCIVCCIVGCRELPLWANYSPSLTRAWAVETQATVQVNYQVCDALYSTDSTPQLCPTQSICFRETVSARPDGAYHEKSWKTLVGIPQQHWWKDCCQSYLFPPNLLPPSQQGY